MERFVVQGGRPIAGTMTPAGNKNEALPCFAAALLTDEPVTLENVPDIADVRTMAALLEALGAEIDRVGDHAYRIGRLGEGSPALDLAQRIRGSFLLAGPLLIRRGEVRLPSPGGDPIGRRRLDTHLLAFRTLGATIRTGKERYLMEASLPLRGTEVFLDEASVMGTENAVMAAVGAEGTTTISNAASEPHVQGLCRMLSAMGAEIRGVGTNRLEIEGGGTLSGTTHRLSPDHVEVGSYVGLAAATGGELRIEDAGVENLAMVRLGFARLGVECEFEGDDLVVPGEQTLAIVDDEGGAVPTLDDAPWPGFPADLVSIMVVVATQAHGTILIHEKMFESRLFFVDRLKRMGARIILCDPHRAIVNGPTPLTGARISSPDIRAGMALLIAALAARGESVIQNVDQIDRGYEAIDERLRALGARIERVGP
ncbi:MAG: UDP-N-acetylglucosamine 1-carboxyvinyltransferase [Gemmatimonadota bacterium]|nr:UDP-N-acetylglucosamine 1-carboxyvinyltransferase [Gemmatimonadota bacterium]